MDAYPLPLIPDVINQIAQYKVHSTVDMESAYNQIEISDEDKPLTAFEANGCLYQFCRLPFGVSSRVAIFQCEIVSMVGTMYYYTYTITVKSPPGLHFSLQPTNSYRC